MEEYYRTITCGASPALDEFNAFMKAKYPNSPEQGTFDSLRKSFASSDPSKLEESLIPVSMGGAEWDRDNSLIFPVPLRSSIDQ